MDFYEQLAIEIAATHKGAARLIKRQGGLKGSFTFFYEK